MLDIVYRHHPRNEKPGLNPDTDQSLCQALLTCAYIELWVHGALTHLNIIRMQCLSLSFIERQQCYRVLGILKGGKQAEDHLEPNLLGALISREWYWI